MVTLLPASRASEDDKGSSAKPARHIRFALDAPQDAKKVKVKAKFTFPSRKKADNDERMGGG
jgi:hypothetical protein